ncbi:unnamed protein product, partial [Prorocentrum cordatum]
MGAAVDSAVRGESVAPGKRQRDSDLSEGVESVPGDASARRSVLGSFAGRGGAGSSAVQDHSGRLSCLASVPGVLPGVLPEPVNDVN